MPFDIEASAPVDGVPVKVFVLVGRKIASTTLVAQQAAQQAVAAASAAAAVNNEVHRGGWQCGGASMATGEKLPAWRRARHSAVRPVCVLSRAAGGGK